MPSIPGAVMLMTAEGAYLAETTGGRDKKAEMREAIDEVINAGRTDGPAMTRLCGKE